MSWSQLAQELLSPRRKDRKGRKGSLWFPGRLLPSFAPWRLGERSFLPRAQPQLEALEDRWLPATITWINPFGGSWHSSANWDLGRIPKSTDDVVINSTFFGVYSSSNAIARSITASGKLTILGGTMQVTQTSTIGTLALAGGTMKTAAALGVTGLLDWSGGELDGSGQVNVQGDASIRGTTTKTLDGMQLNLFGTTEWAGGRVQADDGAVIANQAGAVFLVTGGTRLDPAFVNNGQVLFRATDLVRFGTFANAGEVSLESGLLRAFWYVQTAGVTNLAGAVLASTVAVTLDGGSLTGAGTVDASVLNRAGLVQPDAGQTLQIDGNYTQLADGKLALTVFAPVGGNLLSVAGTATLGGALSVKVIGAPSASRSYRLVEASNRVGQFATTQTTTVSGWSLSVVYLADAVDLLAQLAPRLPTLGGPTYTGPVSSGPGATTQAPIVTTQATTKVAPTVSTTTTHSDNTYTEGSQGSDAIRFLLTPTGGVYVPNTTGRPGETVAAMADLSGAAAYNRMMSGASLSSADRSSGGQSVPEVIDDLLGRLTLPLPEVDLPTDEEALAVGDVLWALLGAGRARADILPHAGGQLSVVATVVSGEEAGPREISGGVNPLRELLVNPLDGVRMSAWKAAPAGPETPLGGEEEVIPAGKNGNVRGVLFALAGFLGVILCALVSRERQARQASHVSLASRA